MFLFCYENFNGNLQKLKLSFIVNTILYSFLNRNPDVWSKIMQGKKSAEDKNNKSSGKITTEQNTIPSDVQDHCGKVLKYFRTKKMDKYHSVHYYQNSSQEKYYCRIDQ